MLQSIRAIQLQTLPAGVISIDKPHKFLWPSLLKEIHFYKDSQESEYVSFFGCIHFALVENDATNSQIHHLKSKPSCVYNFIPAGEDLGAVEISKALRGSQTLMLSDRNTFDSTSVKAVFAEKGAWIWAKKNGSNTYNRYFLLYLLARSTNLYAERQLEKVAQAYESKDLSRMIQYREAVLAFDLKCYYFNPVLIDRHELHQAWPVLANLYQIPQVHDEMKTQVQDLSELIVAKQQTKQESRYKRIEIGFWVVGVLISFITIF